MIGAAHRPGMPTAHTVVLPLRPPPQIDVLSGPLKRKT